jgi:predicted secreted protein
MGFNKWRLSTENLLETRKSNSNASYAHIYASTQQGYRQNCK